MFHLSTERLIAAWSQARGARRVPRRADFSPAALGPVIPQAFVLRAEGGVERVRLSGALVEDLHGRRLIGEDAADLWSGLSRSRFREALRQARREARPVVIRAAALSAEGDEIGLEVALAPLSGPSGEVDRTVGLYQPTSFVARLMRRPIAVLTVREIAPAPLPPRSGVGHLRLVAEGGRRVA